MSTLSSFRRTIPTRFHIVVSGVLDSGCQEDTQDWERLVGNKKTIRTYIAFLSYRSPGPGYITEITESKVAARIKGAQISTLARNNLRQEE
ncbi:hypothetical protein Y032_0002g738 [Ancylostoma ceylanicum]|uniref:Uncharacterized protein n=1 Tax=Ancylostoma ceylanicum TaxID=53326 RepID=A0A016W0F9_9BILA|nr:hypothetical protein Y032_0002g738 [Ancylostoma ceylanicum]